MRKIQELPQSSSRLLTSSQIISSVYCVVKELIENALDSFSRNIEVKLEDYGVEKIEVKDSGCGIDKEDIQFVAKSHFTSKISSYSDLEKVSTYGFRGEALGAICAVADLVITTRTSEQSIGHLINFDHDGGVILIKPFPCAQGTTVSVKNLFKNLPVRKQYYRSEKNKKDELRKIEDILIAYGCIQHDVRFVLYHNKNLIWQKPCLPSTKNALLHILGSSIVDHLKHSEYIDEGTQRKIEFFLPKLQAPLTCSLNSCSRCITAINCRPVRIKEVDKLLKEYYNKSIQNTGKSRFPICFISFTTPLSEVDVNIEPNKTTVMLHNLEEILALLSEMLKTFYNSDVCENNMPPENSSSHHLHTSNASHGVHFVRPPSDTQTHQSKLVFTANSPLSSVNQFPNKTVNSTKTVEKKDNALTKREVNVVGTPHHSKKKLKTSISKSDIEHHVNTLKNFFSGDENNPVNDLTRQTDDPFSGVPRVTVQRFSSNQNISSEENKLESNTDSVSRIPTISIQRICSDENNPDVSKMEKCVDSVNEVPTISNQKIPLNQTNLCSAKSNLENHINSKRITTFAVNTNLTSNSNSLCIGNNENNRKRPFSESSTLMEKVNEDDSKRPNFNNQNEENWSRGVHPSGGLFQPVKILQPGTVNEQKSDLKDKVDNGREKEMSKQKTFSFERKLTVFDIFCRSHRLEVSAENPEFNNQQIAQILTEKWNRLSTAEKAFYKNILDKDYQQHVKKKEKLSKAVSSNLNKEKNNSFSCKTSKKKLKPEVKEKSIAFHMDEIKSFHQSHSRISPPSENLNLINYLAPGIWMCAKGTKLYILNVFRLQETIIYHRLLETFHFEINPLDVSKSIYASQLGDECMEVLMQLYNLNTNAGKFSDERLTANGFDIRFDKGQDNEISIELFGIANNIAFYGMPDLKELLLLIKNKGLTAKLSECRPGKIILYLQSEANRMSRQSPACQRVQDVEDLLRQKNQLSAISDECIHYKPFFSEIYDIPCK